MKLAILVSVLLSVGVLLTATGRDALVLIGLSLTLVGVVLALVSVAFLGLRSDNPLGISIREMVKISTLELAIPGVIAMTAFFLMWSSIGHESDCGPSGCFGLSPDDPLMAALGVLPWVVGAIAVNTLVGLAFYGGRRLLSRN